MFFLILMGFAFPQFSLEKKNIEFQHVQIIVEKSRDSLNSRPALEFNEFARK